METLGETLGLTKMKFYNFYIFKALVCFAGFVVNVLAFGSQSTMLFWVGMMSICASLAFYFLGE
jgi:hypothetical protein